jgi:hypothetical protein
VSRLHRLLATLNQFSLVARLLALWVYCKLLSGKRQVAIQL